MKYFKNPHSDLLHNVVSLDEYGDGDIDSFLSASKLSISPRQFWLSKRHRSQLETCDPFQPLSDAYDMFIGKCVHVFFETKLPIIDAKRYSVERRLYYDFNIKGKTYIVSGQYDVLDKQEMKLWDIKTMTADKYSYSVSNPSSLDNYYLQLHMNRFLLSEGYFIHKDKKVYPKLLLDSSKAKLQVIIKDWSTNVRYSNRMPLDPYPVIDIPNLKTETVKEFLIDKITELIEHEDTPDDELPECSMSYRFQKPTTYPVFSLTKEGKKRKSERALPGTADFLSIEEAEIFINNHQNRESLYCNPRTSVPNRCIKYCEVGKAGFCNWINKWRQDNG